MVNCNSKNAHSVLNEKMDKNSFKIWSFLLLMSGEIDQSLKNSKINECQLLIMGFLKYINVIY